MSFKLDLKGIKPGLPDISLGVALHKGWCEILWFDTSVEVGEGDPCSSKDARVTDVSETVEAPEYGHLGIRASPQKSPREMDLLQCP